VTIVAEEGREGEVSVVIEEEEEEEGREEGLSSAGTA